MKKNVFILLLQERGENEIIQMDRSFVAAQ